MCKSFDLPLKLLRANRINQFQVIFNQLAKIRVKFGENEVEIDSRDFYVDNQTVGNVIDAVTKSMQENKARIVFDDRSLERLDKITEKHEPIESLKVLDDAEAHEPEFCEPIQVSLAEIKEKLNLLVAKSFFDTPRTVSETVEQLREYGWAASPLDVSKILAKMAFSREILKNSLENRNFYFAKKALLAN